jgi:hypothetical protein
MHLPSIVQLAGAISVDFGGKHCRIKLFRVGPQASQRATSYVISDWRA